MKVKSFEAVLIFSLPQDDMENGAKLLHESENGSSRNGKTVSLGRKRVIPKFVVSSFGFAYTKPHASMLST